MKLTPIAAAFLLTSLVAAPASEQAKLKSFDRGSWQKLLHSHAGHPILVHFWGLRCGPCKVGLPELGEFMKQYPSVDVVMIDADFMPNSDGFAASILKDAGLASAENWMFSGGLLERQVRYEVDPAWQGDIPRTILISKGGDTVTIEGCPDPAALQKWSDEQVATTK